MKKILLLFSLMWLLTGCQKTNSVKSEQPANPSEWTVFRGNSQLTGVAGGKIFDNLKMLWSFETGDDVRSTPIISNNTVFVGSTDKNMYALSLDDGTVIWKFTMEDDIEAPALYYDGIVYAGSLDGTFYALSADSGKVIWSVETGDQILGAPNIYFNAAKKARILVGSYDFKMYCYDAKTGSPVWSYETDNFINGAPATDGKRIVFGGCDEFLHVVDVNSGKKLAAIPAGSYIAASAAIRDHFAYVGHYDSKLICLDLDQQSVVWEYEDEKNGAPFFSSPAVTEKYVIAGSRDDYVHCIDRETGKPVWKFKTLDQVDSSPVVIDNKVIVGSEDGRLYMLDLNTGQQLWSFEIGSSIIGSPAVADGKIIIGADDGRIYAFGEKV